MVLGEQAEEEMTLRPPCSAGEKRVIHSGGDGIGPGDCRGKTGFGQRDDRVRGANQQRSAGCHEGKEPVTRAVLMWKRAWGTRMARTSCQSVGG